MSEIKYSNTAATPNSVNVSPQIIALTPDFAQGAGRNNRIANAIKYKRMVMRMNIWAVAAQQNANSVAQLRVILFQPRLPFSTPNPLVSDILDTANFLSPVNAQKARTLYDKQVNLSVWGNNSMASFQLSPMFSKKIRRPINNNVAFRDGAQVTPLDIKDQYYLLVFPSSAIVNDYTVNVQYYFRISYTDL